MTATPAAATSSSSSSRSVARRRGQGSWSFGTNRVRPPITVCMPQRAVRKSASGSPSTGSDDGRTTIVEDGPRAGQPGRPVLERVADPVDRHPRPLVRHVHDRPGTEHRCQSRRLEGPEQDASSAIGIDRVEPHVDLGEVADVRQRRSRHDPEPGHLERDQADPRRAVELVGTRPGREQRGDVRGRHPPVQDAHALPLLGEDHAPGQRRRDGLDGIHPTTVRLGRDGRPPATLRENGTSARERHSQLPFSCRSAVLARRRGGGRRVRLPGSSTCR